MEENETFEDEHPVIASCAQAAGDVVKVLKNNKTTVFVVLGGLAVISRFGKNRSRD